MSDTSVRTAGLMGPVGAQMVIVEADIADGPPGIVIADVSNSDLREARDRVRVAIINDGGQWPHATITIGLLPAQMSSASSAYCGVWSQDMTDTSAHHIIDSLTTSWTRAS